MNDTIKSIMAKSLLYTPKQAKYLQDMQILTLECKRIMEGIYSPAVACFMLELAGRRGRLEQLRGMVGMSLKVDDIRRIIMAEAYYSPHMILQLTSRDMTKFIWELPFKQYGRFGIIWRNIWYRIRRRN